MAKYTGIITPNFRGITDGIDLEKRSLINIKNKKEGGIADEELEEDIDKICDNAKLVT